MWLPDPDSLLCFLRAAETLNFRRAAREVGLTASAFGTRLKTLEHKLGEDLFERTTRSVQLTSRGRAMVPAAQAALESLRRCGDGAKAAVLPIQLGTRHELGLSWLLPEVDALERAIPELRLSLAFGSGDEILSRLRAGALDAVVSSSRIHDKALQMLALHEEQYTFVAAERLLRTSPFTSSGHAGGHTLLDLDATLPLFRYFADAARAPKLAFSDQRYFGTIDALKARVLSGRGVAVLPSYLVGRELRAGKLRALFPKVTPHADAFRLVCRRGDPRVWAFEQIAAHLRETPLR